MSDKSEIRGTFEPPPAHAPREVTSSNVAATADQIAAARNNERSLQPLVFEPGKPLDVPMQKVEPRLAKAFVPSASTNPMPAQSETDSPSRGIPRPIDDPGKAITGGFGHAGPPQYFPLDGTELKEAVRALMDELNGRLDRDLRFHIGITYPRVTAIVSIGVKGWTGDTDFKIEKTFVHDKTSEEIAQAAGAERVDFEVQESIQEFDSEGNPQDPPDRVRDQLGLEKPRKQMVQTPTGRQMVDRPSTLLNSF